MAVRTESPVIFLNVLALGDRPVGRARTPYGVLVVPPASPPAAHQAIPRPRRLAGALLAVQVVTILGFCVFYLVELAIGRGADTTQTIMSVVVFLGGAALLAFLARGLWRGSPWTRTPGVLWNVFVALIAVSLGQSGQWLLAVLVGAVAVGGIVGIVAPSRGPRGSVGPGRES